MGIEILVILYVKLYLFQLLTQWRFYSCQNLKQVEDDVESVSSSGNFELESEKSAVSRTTELNVVSTSRYIFPFPPGQEKTLELTGDWKLVILRQAEFISASNTWRFYSCQNLKQVEDDVDSVSSSGDFRAGKREKRCIRIRKALLNTFFFFPQVGKKYLPLPASGLEVMWNIKSVLRSLYLVMEF